MPISQKLKTLRLLLNHPLSRGRRLRAAIRFFSKQLQKRRDEPSNEVGIPFDWVNQTRFLRGPDVTNGNDQWLFGLTEMEEMGFLLHYLRPEDLFVDVGANEGAFTVLASAACSAEAVSVEPVPDTHAVLCRNVELNGIADRVSIHHCACGEESGEELAIEVGARSTLNAVVTDQSRGDIVSMPVRALDEIVGEREVSLLKIDVEGFETAVLGGFTDAITGRRVGAAIIELSGLGERYGFDENAIREHLVQSGLHPCRYDPRTRELSPSNPGENEGPCALFVRDLESTRERLRQADAFKLDGMSI